jgi:hypothetical protein
VSTLANNPNGDGAMRIARAELSLSLPGMPPVRRELLRPEAAARVFTLRPDGTQAHVTLEVGGTHLIASLAGPEQADIEIEWLVEGRSPRALPLWAIAEGRDAEVAVWDAFGRLMVPDVLARGTDAPDIEFVQGRYLLTASAFGRGSLLIGAGIAAELAMPMRRLRGVAG